MDLNPKYAELMHQRAVRLANIWMTKVGDKLLKDTDFLGRKIFKKEVNDGKRLSVDEIGKLKHNWKTDYFTEILKYDDKVTVKIADEHAKVLKEHVENLG